MDDKLFESILVNQHHVFHQLLPLHGSDYSYSLKPHKHNFTLTIKSQLDEQNVIYRLVYQECTEIIMRHCETLTVSL